MAEVCRTRVVKSPVQVRSRHSSSFQPVHSSRGVGSKPRLASTNQDRRHETTTRQSGMFLRCCSMYLLNVGFSKTRNRWRLTVYVIEESMLVFPKPGRDSVWLVYIYSWWHTEDLGWEGICAHGGVYSEIAQMFENIRSYTFRCSQEWALEQVLNLARVVKSYSNKPSTRLWRFELHRHVSQSRAVW